MQFKSLVSLVEVSNPRPPSRERRGALTLRWKGGEVRADFCHLGGLIANNGSHCAASGNPLILLLAGGTISSWQRTSVAI